MNPSITRPLVLRSVLATLCVAALSVAASLSTAQDKPTAPGPKPALSVALIVPQQALLAQTLAANGNLAAWQEASIGAQAGGQRLTEVRVNVGDRVTRGQVLAVFATDTLGAEAAQARAAVAEADAAAAEAAANADRARTLQASGALSASQINQYLTAEKTAQARLQSARAQAQVQQARLSQSQVLAPDDGIVSARQATVGAVVGNGTELFRLIRQGRLEWRAEVTSAELGRVAPGTAATLTTASGAKLQGRVRMIGPTVDPQTRNALVYVDVRPAAGSAAPALPGMFARGEFTLGAALALSVPQSAVVVREGFSYVMRVNPDNRVSAVKVQTGRVAGDRVEITSGLPADARLVASGGSFLNEGDLVRVVPATAVKPAK
jgi:HlyD family secretion protein